MIRLKPRKNGRPFGGHRHFQLADLVRLPAEMSRGILARELGITPMAVTGWIKKGLPHRLQEKMGRKNKPKYVIERDDLITWMLDSEYSRKPKTDEEVPVNVL